MPQLKNAKREQFCREYVVDNNATQAAIRVKYSEKTAKSQGQRLLTDVDVQERIAELRLELQKATGISAEKVIQEFARIALVDPGEAFNEDGDLLSVKQMPRDLRGAISAIEVTTRTYGKEDRETTETIRKIRFWDKNKALENLGKHLGIFLEDNKQKAESLAEFLKGVEK